VFIPNDAMHGFEFIQDLAVVMMVAGFVGWLCHRIGLSVIVGYLAAGVVIGPYTPPFSLVSSVPRIETLAQMGLVFLMFSIGMKLSLRKLRRLGWPLVIATVVGAVVMYNISRLVGAGLGWNPVQKVFLAAMLMVSSSAIISKVLQELGATHEKSGQMAMGVSVLEDIVAVVMLTILSSLTAPMGGGVTSIGSTLGMLGAFVVVAGVGGLLAVPWLLRKLSTTAEPEQLTIVVAGLLFMLAIFAAKAGFSVALGAFLLGAIVAETPHRLQVDRTFEGMRDLFSAVFFVAIGMMINLQSALHLWWLMLLLGVVTLVGRTLALTTGMLVTGSSTREALAVGLSVTPLGEFSFIIVQMGIFAGVLADDFQAVVVGVSLITTLVAPILTKRATTISEWADTRQPDWLKNWIEYYHRWLEKLTLRQKRNLIWQLSRKRLIQITVEVLLVTGLLVFSESAFQAVSGYLPDEKLFRHAPRIIFSVGLGLIAMVPVVAIWRNVAALAMLFGEMSTVGYANAARLRPLVETGTKILAGGLMVLWLSAIVPHDGMGRWVPLVALLLAAILLVFMRSKLIFWHSVLEVELQERLVQPEKHFSSTATPWLAEHGEWNLGLTECVLPDLAACRGRTLGELALRTRYGCVVAGVERQGVMIGNPSTDLILYPHDKVLLLGDTVQSTAGKIYLQMVTVNAPASRFDEVRLETVTIPAGSLLAGCTLAELSPSRKCGVQVAGLLRGKLRLLNPGGDEHLRVGDHALVLGSPDQIEAFRQWANES